MIRIVNLKNYKLEEGEVLFKVDRSTVLGNPFFMKDESCRDEVCDKYEIYFYQQIELENVRFVQKLDKLYNLAQTQNIVLACWCFPKKCHAETIKEYIERKLEMEK